LMSGGGSFPRWRLSSVERATHTKKGAPEGAPNSGRTARLKANVRAEREAPALLIVEEAVATSRTQARIVDTVIVQVQIGVDAGERRLLIEQVVHAEPQSDMLVQFVPAVEAEQVVGR